MNKSLNPTLQNNQIQKNQSKTFSKQGGLEYKLKIKPDIILGKLVEG